MTSKLDELMRPIAALASGSGGAAIAIIRFSGEGSHELVERLLRPRRGGSKDAAKSGSKPLRGNPGKLRYCDLIDPGDAPRAEAQAQESRTLDDVMAVLFEGPASYTGEDSGEIHCHGSPYLIQAILSLLYRSGFTPAEPGEFTRRAYLNGRIDLTQAEGIKALIAANSEQQWLAGRLLADGRLKDEVEGLRKDLVAAMAYLEASIDFPDEGETANLERSEVNLRVDKVADRLAQLHVSYRSGHVAGEGLRVLLCGLPNAGKSTLLNALLRKDRAIVSEIAGTTRDYIEEACLLDGRYVRLIDTAGLRETSDRIEALGIGRTLQLAREADLILELYPSDFADADFEAFERILRDLPSSTPRIKVLTKADLPRPAWAARFAKDSWVEVSILSVERLVAAICAAVDADVQKIREQPFIVNARQADCIAQALQAIEAFRHAALSQAYDECLAFELQGAARALNDLIGDISNDDVLDEVFSTFCLGK